MKLNSSETQRLIDRCQDGEERAFGGIEFHEADNLDENLQQLDPPRTIASDSLTDLENDDTVVRRVEESRR